MGPLQLPLAVNLHFSPPDGRSTRYDRQDFVVLACRAQRTVQVRLRAPRGSRLALTVLSPTSPRHVVRNAGQAADRAAPRDAWLLQRRGRLRATVRAGSIHCTDRRPRPTGQTRSVRQSPRRLHAITGAASIRAPDGSRLDQTILFAASMMWRAEIPNRSSKDAEGPLRGMERTASL